MSVRSRWAADVIAAYGGDVIVVPIVLARSLGLATAAFLRQAAFLSAIVHDSREGWFFLQQEGVGNPSGQTIFERLGSWQAALGVGQDAQVTARRHLVSLGLLEEKRKGMVHGQLSYRVDPEKYLDFLAECEQQQTGNPVCTNGEHDLSKPGNPACTNGKSPATERKHIKEAKNKNQEEEASTADGNKNHPTKSQAGILCWNQEDQEDATNLERTHGAEKIRQAIEKLKAGGKDPLPSRVRKLLTGSGTGVEMPAGWWTSDQATQKAGEVLGLPARPGELMGPYRERLRQEFAAREQKASTQTHDEETMA